jgi:hypothetical protein
MAEGTERLSAGHAAKEAMNYRLIFAAAFAAFLLEAIARRMLVRLSRISTESGGEKSVIAEARAAACKYVPFAFMG